MISMNESQPRINWFQTISQLVLLVTFFLLPFFFLPTGYLSFQYSKILLVTIGVIAALTLFFIEGLKRGRFKIPAHPIFLVTLAMPLVFIISALFASPRWLSLTGYGFEIGTASFIALMFILFYLVVILFQSYSKSYYPYLLFFVSFSLLAIFHIVRMVVGAEAILPNVFGGPLANTVGNWNGLAIFFGIATVLSAVTSDLLKDVSQRVKLFLTIAFIVSLVLLALMNFSTLFVVLAVLLLGTGFYMYFAGQSGLLSRSMIAGIVALILVIPVIPTANGFNSLGAYVGNIASEQFGIGNAEVRPSWEATFDVVEGTITSDTRSALLGSGPNTFSRQWNVHKPLDVNRTQFWNTDFTYGVGLVPTFFVTTGILGIVAIALFFGFLLFGIFRLLYITFESPFARYMVCSSLILSVYLWAFLVIYTPGVVLVTLAFFFTGMFVASLYRYGILPSRTVHLFENKKTAPFYVALLVVLLVAGLLFGFVIARKALSSTYFQRSAEALTVDGDIARSQNLLVQAINLSENDLYYRALSELQLIQLANLLNQETELEELAQTQLQGFLDGALAAAQRAILLNRENYQNHVALGRVYAQVLSVDGALKGAENAFLAAREANPMNPVFYLDLARLRSAGGDDAGAREFINEALILKPNYTAAVFLKAQLDINAGNTAQAIAGLEQALVTNPNDPNLYFQLGLLKYNEDNFTGAREAFENAVIRDPQFANARYFLGLSYYEVGNNEAAVEQFQILMDLFPDNQEVGLILRNLQSGQEPFTGAEPPITDSPEDREDLPVEDGGTESDALEAEGSSTENSDNSQSVPEESEA